MTKDLGLLVLRLSGFGLAFAHGWQKMSLLATGNGERIVGVVEALGFPMPLMFAWAAGLAEFVGGLAIALGIGTRIAAAFAAFTMFVASTFQHRLPQHILTWIGAMNPSAETVESWGNPERAATYMLIFAGLVLLGGGRFSLDRFVRRDKK